MSVTTKTARQQKTERNRLSGLSQATLLSLRADKKQRDAQTRSNQQKAEEGSLELPVDFVSMMLVRWSLTELLRYTKVLLAIVNRNKVPPVPGAGNGILQSLLYMSYPSEYGETLFAEHAMIEYEDGSMIGVGEELVATFGDEDGDEVTRTVYHKMPFRQYYNLVYSEVKRACIAKLENTQRRHYITLLSGCFLIALMYDPRIRRFVLKKHDIHYKKMQTTPSSVPKVMQFLATVQPAIDDFLARRIAIDVMCDFCIEEWCRSHMLGDWF